MQDLSLQHISNILWAYVSFLQMREPMTSAFLEELKLRLRKATFNAQQLSNLLWSLCIAEVGPPLLLTHSMPGMLKAPQTSTESQTFACCIFLDPAVQEPLSPRPCFPICSKVYTQERI